MKIDSLQAGGMPAPEPTGATAPDEEAFRAALMQAEMAVASPERESHAAVDAMVKGAGGDLHDTMLTMEKTSISLSYLVSVRNKCLDAYRELMRTEV